MRLPLLIDTLAQTQTEAHNIRAWQRLWAQTNANPDPSAQQTLLQRLHDLKGLEGFAEIYRLSFLYDATLSPEYRVQLGSLLKSHSTHSNELLMLFVTRVWGELVLEVATHTELHHALSAANAPRILTTLAARCRQLLEGDSALRPISTKAEGIRVALVSPCIGHKFHPPSKLLFQQSKLLSAAGVDHKIFSAQELVPPDQDLFCVSDRRLQHPPPDFGFVAASLPAGISAIIADPTYSLNTRWAEHTRLIHEYAPDLIYFCGFYSPLVAALHEQYPVLAMNIHALPPMCPADVWLSNNADKTHAALWPASLSPTDHHHHPYRIQPATTAPSKPNNKDGASISLLSVGYRLGSEIKGDWASKMKHLLRQNSHITWKLAGVSEIPDALKDHPGTQIIALGPVENISDLLSESDLYINPPRIGGGFSVSEAMQHGIPVVSLCDSDGGSKLGTHASQDLNGYFFTLQQLINDKSARIAASQSMKEIFERDISETEARGSLISAITKTIDIGRNRINKAINLRKTKS